MKIGVDAQPLTRQKFTGIDYYILNVLQNLVRLSPDDEFQLCYFGDETTKLPLTGNNASRKPIKFPRRIYQVLFRYLVSPAYDSVAKSDSNVFLFTDFVALPLHHRQPQAVIVYDLGFLEVPETVAPRLRRYLTKFVPRSIKRADRVITISEHTKREIISHYGTDAEKISVITPAVDHTKYAPANKAAINNVQKSFNIKDGYILFIGTIEPRKNIAGLIRAYQALPQELQQSHQLVLAGGKGWLDDEITQLITQLGDRVIQTGYVREEDKAALYSGASVFAYPSLYEGWGMQPLEAMACGTPVIVSNNSSLPEVVGDAAIMIDAKNTKSITDAIQKVLTDPKLATELRQKGLNRAMKFSWAESGMALKKVISSLI